MHCGFCGTQVKEGFDTCAACGARYERVLIANKGPFTFLFIFFGLPGGFMLFAPDASASIRLLGVALLAVPAAYFFWKWPKMVWTKSR